jgi:hypothetical protein
MNEVQEWAKTCLNKSKFTESSADLKLGQLKLKGVILNKYYCPHCCGWHLTKKPRIETIYGQKLADAMKEIESLKIRLIEKDDVLRQLREQNDKLQKLDKLTDKEKKAYKKDKFHNELLFDNERLQSKIRGLKKDYEKIFNRLMQSHIEKPMGVQLPKNDI